MDVQLILGVLEQGLKLWNSKEADKYISKLIKLKKEWYEEYNKPLNERSDVKLDYIELQLRILCQSFIQAPKRENTSH
jgi:uncharacterized membrane protein YheB (UPF0754 family)